MRPGRSQLTNPMSYRSILGSKLGELWHCGAGISLSTTEVTGWTGLVRGIQLVPGSSGTRPTYGVDSTYFTGRSVVQCSKTNSSGLAATVSAIGSGTDCGYLAVVGRMRSEPATVNDYDSVCHVYNTAGSRQAHHFYSTLPREFYGTVPPADSARGYVGLMYSASPAVSDFTTKPIDVSGAQVFLEYDLKGGVDAFAVPVPAMYQDGAFWCNCTGTGPFPALGAVDTFKIGTDGFHFSNLSVALFIYCFDTLTATQRSQLHELVKSEFGGA